MDFLLTEESLILLTMLVGMFGAVVGLSRGRS
jgi:hypothetical protein